MQQTCLYTKHAIRHNICLKLIITSNYICKALINHQQQQKRCNDIKEVAKVLPDLHIGQDVLYIPTQGDWLPGKNHQISQSAEVP